jgi:protein-S-isoprenylcysteine O-methyltransferase Ste14
VRSLRALLSFLILPGTVIGLVPFWLGRRYDIGWQSPEGGWDVAGVCAAVPLLGLGLTLLFTCVARFFTRGRGTLAPWDPPRHLVVEGAYRHVRNPMISGVILTLFGMALGLRSVPHAVWAAGFSLLALIVIPLWEEPQLEQRFGEEYRNYKRHVPGLLPRRRPWSGEGSGEDDAA